jgi:RNA binding exosome subunit
VIKSATIGIICHATEDEAKVQAGAEKLFGVKFAKTGLSGHWGNPIAMLEGRMNEKEAKEVAEKLKAQIKVGNFDGHSSDGEFFVRVSKSGLVRGELCEGDDVKIRFGLPGMKARGVSEFFRKFWKA